MNKLFAIYEVNPTPKGNDYRFIQAFDRREDAQKVLDALESVNIDFNIYELIEEKIR